MNNLDFVFQAYLDDYIKIAKVNLYTGQYEFIKSDNSPIEVECRKAPTIDEYERKIVDLQMVYESDARKYLAETSRENILREIQNKRYHMIHSFRRRTANDFIWVSIEVIIPRNFDRENPWVVYNWKEADTDSRNMEDALNMLSTIYHKILKINLTRDTHKEIKVYEQEMTPEFGYSGQLSKWFRSFAEQGYIDPDDVTDYLAFTNLGTLREYFHSNKECTRFRYRRKINGAFRWVCLELLPSVEYTETNQVVMLYVRDIHDAYISELQHQKEAEYYSRYDALTGLQNRHSFNLFSDHYKAHRKHKIGVFFTDMNSLKYINDYYGHAAGDDYIVSFAKLLAETFTRDCCYRFSGDEFLIILENEEKDDFFRKAEHFHNMIKCQQRPMAAMGYAWEEAPATLEPLVASAEIKMHADKQLYYVNHPEYSR